MRPFGAPPARSRAATQPKISTITAATTSWRIMYFEIPNPDFTAYRLSSSANGCGIRIFPSNASLKTATSVTSGCAVRRNAGTSSSVFHPCRQSDFGTSKK